MRSSPRRAISLARRHRRGDRHRSEPRRRAVLRAAAAEGLTITHVTETHIHADFVSGSRELAARTGATLYLSDEGDADWKYAFAAEAGAVLLKDGDTFTVGNIRIDVVHTPGHTPEHLVFSSPTPPGREPMAAVTGDFVFVGDVGRPDLLERAAGVAGTMEGAARALFRSLQRFKPYPDYLQIWPGHGAGSACGKGSARCRRARSGTNAASTGRSRRRRRRVRHARAGGPARAAAVLRRDEAHEQGGPARAWRLSQARAAAVRTRSKACVAAAPSSSTRARPADSRRRTCPGTINIPLNRSFTTWAGWLVPYASDFYLIVDDGAPQCLDEAVRDLAMIGLDRIAGYAGTEILEQWVSAGRALGRVSQIDADSLAQKLRTGTVVVVDVRSRAEWDAGHIPAPSTSRSGILPDRLASLSKSRPVVVQCQRGARSAIAASLLRAHGFPQVINLAGGFTEWQAAGQPVDREVKDDRAGVH